MWEHRHNNNAPSTTHQLLINPLPDDGKKLSELIFVKQVGEK